MNPIIYTADQHSFHQSDCDPDALKVIYALQNAGYIAYLVGGSVRDLILGITPKDYDISTSASPEQIKQLFKGQCLLIGRRFRLAHIRFKNKVFEVSTFRSGDNESEELILRDNVWGTPEQDVLRRDFTMNGLFYDPVSHTVIDFVGGYADIKKKYLRTVGLAFLRFKQDPVRMIRLLKFQARFDFTIDPEVTLALAECYPELAKSSQARVFEEILKMLESGYAEKFIDLMHEHRFFELLIPEFSHFLSSLEGEDTLDLLCEIDLLIKTEPLDRSILLAALCFPFLQKSLKIHFLDRKKSLSAPELYDEVQSVISQLFHPFFLIPRKLRMQVTAILTAQFRIKPLYPSKTLKIRIPRDPEFTYALTFFKLRSHLDPTLKSTFNKWQSAYEKLPLNHFQKKSKSSYA
ncbi:polynucleotide adenylyltransferase PcnB [Rhabdochlamydiaceae symbiont of Dictyostelium giganteum]|uniref:polynucleotide adenylyltransferase PcnB n=1 Tax=Rhabdochlamydiaceae symbiont of Dictyostelium giganteum TaxID=3342349 RepID=UPI00384F489F